MKVDVLNVHGIGSLCAVVVNKDGETTGTVLVNSETPDRAFWPIFIPEDAIQIRTMRDALDLLDLPSGLTAQPAACKYLYTTSSIGMMLTSRMQVSVRVPEEKLPLLLDYIKGSPLFRNDTTAAFVPARELYANMTHLMSDAHDAEVILASLAEAEKSNHGA